MLPHKLARSYYHDLVPRLIDHDARREELAEAVWRVLARDGVSGVSVRTVAAEAGVSTGSLRHLLPSKVEMLAAALTLVVERASARFLARAQSPLRTRGDVVALLAEMLPLDDTRRLELRAHLALMLESAAHPALAPLRRPLDDAMRTGCRSVLTAADAAGLLRAHLDLDAEAERLHAIVDGLALHLLGPHGPLDADRALAILEEHLAACG